MDEGTSASETPPNHVSPTEIMCASDYSTLEIEVAQIEENGDIDGSSLCQSESVGEAPFVHDSVFPRTQVDTSADDVSGVGFGTTYGVLQGEGRPDGESGLEVSEPNEPITSSSLSSSPMTDHSLQAEHTSEHMEEINPSDNSSRPPFEGNRTQSPVPVSLRKAAPLELMSPILEGCEAHDVEANCGQEMPSPTPPSASSSSSSDPLLSFVSQQAEEGLGREDTKNGQLSDSSIDGVNQSITLPAAQPIDEADHNLNHEEPDAPSVEASDPLMADECVGVDLGEVTLCESMGVADADSTRLVYDGSTPSGDDDGGAPHSIENLEAVDRSGDITPDLDEPTDEVDEDEERLTAGPDEEKYEGERLGECKAEDQGELEGDGETGECQGGLEGQAAPDGGGLNDGAVGDEAVDEEGEEGTLAHNSFHDAYLNMFHGNDEDLMGGMVGDLDGPIMTVNKSLDELMRLVETRKASKMHVIAYQNSWLHHERRLVKKSKATFFHAALLRAFPEVVKVLMDLSDKICECDGWPCWVLPLAVSGFVERYGDMIRCYVLLLEELRSDEQSIAWIHDGDLMGGSVIHRAAAMGELEVLYLLLAFGEGNPCLLDNHGDAPIFLAVDARSPSCFVFLLSHMISKDDRPSLSALLRRCLTRMSWRCLFCLLNFQELDIEGVHEDEMGELYRLSEDIGVQKEFKSTIEKVKVRHLPLPSSGSEGFNEEEEKMGDATARGLSPWDFTLAEFRKLCLFTPFADDAPIAAPPELMVSAADLNASIENCGVQDGWEVCQAEREEEGDVNSSFGLQHQLLVVGHESCWGHLRIPEPTDSPLHREAMKQLRSFPECTNRLTVLMKPNVGILRRSEFHPPPRQSTSEVSTRVISPDSIGFFEEPTPAVMADILRVHDWGYIKKVMETVNSPGIVKLLDSDTPVTAESWEATRRAAGTVIAAANAVCMGTSRTAFCAVRPPGHHLGSYGACSGPDGMDGFSAGSQGFCLVNNVAIGAAYTRYKYAEKGIRRIAIVDFDVHHGNGTEQIVSNLKPRERTCTIEGRGPYAINASMNLKLNDWKVWLDENDADETFFASIHGYGGDFYPRTGHSEVRVSPYVVNVGLEKYTDPPTYRQKFRAEIITRLARFRPDIIFISAGFDGHWADGLINHGFTSCVEADYEWVTTQIITLANSLCNGRVVSVLEGGYATESQGLSAFARCVASHVRTLQWTSPLRKSDPDILRYAVSTSGWQSPGDDDEDEDDSKIDAGTSEDAILGDAHSGDGNENEDECVRGNQDVNISVDNHGEPTDLALKPPQRMNAKRFGESLDGDDGPGGDEAGGRTPFAATDGSSESPLFVKSYVKRRRTDSMADSPSGPHGAADPLWGSPKGTTSGEGLVTICGPSSSQPRARGTRQAAQRCREEIANRFRYLQPEVSRPSGMSEAAADPVVSEPSSTETNETHHSLERETHVMMARDNSIGQPAEVFGEVSESIGDMDDWSAKQEIEPPQAIGVSEIYESGGPAEEIVNGESSDMRVEGDDVREGSDDMSIVCNESVGGEVDLVNEDAEDVGQTVGEGGAVDGGIEDHVTEVDTMLFGEADEIDGGCEVEDVVEPVPVDPSVTEALDEDNVVVIYSRESHEWTTEGTFDG
eukprot:GHVN01072893.1.p1 GENE.GHVN01072893.1~~GHVN01072893.1.p1  ORF type:complete len:1627 (+),score=343.04 GHVN01072893.1:127-5007(+)